jgi:two-component system, NtrC family, response regulator AtoC
VRREELPLLTEYFMKKYSTQYNRTCTEISPETMSLFMQYEWPGNVRELENVIKRAVVLGGEEEIRKDITRGIALTVQRRGLPPRPSTRAARRHDDLPASPALPANPTQIAAAAHQAGNTSLKEVARTAARQAERELISRVLRQTRWNRKEAAEILSISYKALLYKIKDSGLDKAW